MNQKNFRPPLRFAVDLAQLQRVVAGSAADVEHAMDIERLPHGSFGDKLHRQRCVDGCGLTRFQIAEPIDISIETGLDGRFGWF